MTIQEPGAGSQPAPLAYEQPQTPHNEQGGAPKPKRNVLALVALVISIVGFIFACIPGALIIGWILLPVAFILGLVSLFLKGTGKGLGIAGVIISVVGTVVAVVVFFAVVADSFNDAFSDETTVVEESAEEGESDAGEAPAEEAAAAEGTRENPVAIGSTITSEEWTVVVNSFNADGNATAAADDFNDPAPAGSHYEIVSYTVTYTGTDSSFAAFVGVDLVSSAGNVINSFDNLVFLDDSMGVDELFNGASATGSAAFVVPDGESVLVRVGPGMLADEVFVKP